MTSLYWEASVNPMYRRSYLSANAEAISKTHYQITVQLDHFVFVTRLHYSMIIFDKVSIESSKEYQLYYESIDFERNNQKEVKVPFNLWKNTMIGLTSF